MEKDIYDPVNEEISAHIAQGSFNLTDLENAIRAKGAPMRVEPGHTVREYLSELVAAGILRVDDDQNTFHCNI